MSFNTSPDSLLGLAKDKIRDFHREREAIKLAQEARNFQPGRLRITVNQVVNLFKSLLLRMEKRFGFGHILRTKNRLIH
jgi:hypothetical protein